MTDHLGGLDIPANVHVHKLLKCMLIRLTIKRTRVQVGVGLPGQPGGGTRALRGGDDRGAQHGRPRRRACGGDFRRGAVNFHGAQLPLASG